MCTHACSCSVRSNIVGSLKEASDDWEEDSLKWWNIVVKACMGAFISALGLAFLLIVFVVINWSWGAWHVRVQVGGATHMNFPFATVQ